MDKNNDITTISDLSECNKKQRDSNLEDDTEDYIQPSQPLSFQSPSLESMRKKFPTDNNVREMSTSTIDETLPFPNSMMSTPLSNTSRDFIPESENPVKRKIDISDREEICKKRLNLDESSLRKETPDLFSTQPQLDDTVDASHLQIPPTPAKSDLENVSVPESPPRVNETLESEHSYTMFSESEKRGVLGETTAEDESQESTNFHISDIPKNDISDLQSNGKDNRRTAESTPGEIIVIDSSKFMDDSGMESLLRAGKPPVVAEVKVKVDSQEVPLDDTVDAEDIECYSLHSGDKSDVSEGLNGKSIQPVSEALTSSVERDSEAKSSEIDIKPEISKLKGALKNISDEDSTRLQKHSTPENPLSKSPKINESASSIENGTPPVQDDLTKSTNINFTIYLQLDCQLVMDPHMEEPVSKKIIDVKELIKRQPKQFFVEPNSESSYKTKGHSSSSSGSVYSDKTGLPYPLPSRSLPVSVNSSSSSVDLAKHIKIAERQVWINEHKVPMTMDEIIPRYIEHHKTILETNKGKPLAKRKPSIRLRKKSNWSHPLDNVLESSVTEQSSGNNSDDLLHDVDKSDSSKPKEGFEEKVTKKEAAEEVGKEIVRRVENIMQKIISPSPDESESVDGIISQGLLVFARWTDKRYYPGIILTKAKYDRWEVKFDDDTEKVIREDLILPMNWLTKGELVFALAAEKYMSGKITDIIRNEEIKFKIELDDTNEEIIVKKCDLCLNDVMAGIIREKFKPSNKLMPQLKSSDIDVDNVVTGKRVREQRTPIRGVTSILQPDSSTAKKRKGGINLSESGIDVKADTPVKKSTPLAKDGLNVEKKSRCSSRKNVARAPLPSESDQMKAEEVPSAGGETPIRSDSKTEGRKKRARTLKYDVVKTEFSSGKVRKSETVTNDRRHQSSSVNKRSKSSLKSVACRSDDGIAVAENEEIRKKNRVERKTAPKKSVNNEKDLRRSKSIVIKQEIKKKKKKLI